jgi:outer membrane protein assembly factor BamB
MKTPRLPTLALALGLVTLAAPAADWPQWRGPNRDGISKETGLLQSWPKDGPKLAWTFSNAGIGYSGPAVVAGRLYLTGGRNGSDELFAIDTKTAKELWSVKIGPIFTFKGNIWGDGPRATPSVDGDRVYALGGQGDLVCVGTDGKEIWRKNMTRDLGGEVSQVGGALDELAWGYTWSPLVDGEQMICVPGGAKGTLAALNKKTGAVLWRSQDFKEAAPYASPIVAEIGGVRQYVQVTDHGLGGVAAADGKLLWFYPRNYTDVLIPTPVVQDNLVYASSGTGAGCDLIRLTKMGNAFKAEKVYANKNMKNLLGGVVLVNGYVYGYSEQRGWVCQDFKTGSIKWSDKDLGSGSVIAADGRLYCYGEDDGMVALVEATPEKWNEISRFQIPEQSPLRKPKGRTWTPPVIADGRLYLRDQDLLFGYEIKN